MGSALAAFLLNSLPAPSHLRQGETAAGRLPDPSSAQPLGSMPMVLPGTAPRHSLPRLWSLLCLLSLGPACCRHLSITAHSPCGSENSALVAAHMPSVSHLGSLHTQPAGREAKKPGAKRGDRCGGERAWPGPLPAVSAGLGPAAGYSPPHPGRQYSESTQALWRRTHEITGAQWADVHTGCGSHALQARGELLGHRAL